MSRDNGLHVENKNFKSKTEARKFFLSQEADRHISHISGIIESLYERSKTEPTYRQMGGPDTTESESSAMWTGLA